MSTTQKLKYQYKIVDKGPEYLYHVYYRPIAYASVTNLYPDGYWDKAYEEFSFIWRAKRWISKDIKKHNQVTKVIYEYPKIQKQEQKDCVNDTGTQDTQGIPE